MRSRGLGRTVMNVCPAANLVHPGRDHAVHHHMGHGAQNTRWTVAASELRIRLLLARPPSPELDCAIQEEALRLADILDGTLRR